MLSARAIPPELTVVAHDIAEIGGMERQLWELVGRLARAGTNVTVVGRRCELRHPRVRFVRVPGPARPFSLSYPWFFIAGSLALACNRRGVVHTTGAVVLNRADVSTVHHVHHAVRTTGILPRSRETLLHRINARCAEWQKRLAERYCYRPAITGHAVVPSTGAAREVAHHFPALADRITVIGHGIDHAVATSDAGGGEADRGGHRRDPLPGLGVPGGARVALFVGGDWERKGLRIAVEAIAGAPGWHLVVAGAGDVPRHRALARRAGVEDRVHFAGRPPDVAAHYAHADAFVLPTAYESFSIVTHEAAGHGLPLLVTRVSGVEDILVDGENGWFIAREPADIAARLVTLAERPELLESMGRASRRAAAGRSWDAVADAYAALYARLAS